MWNKGKEQTEKKNVLEIEMKLTDMSWMYLSASWRGFALFSRKMSAYEWSICKEFDDEKLKTKLSIMTDKIDWWQTGCYVKFNYW